MSNYIETIDFIRNQYPTKEYIPLHEPNFNGKEKEYVLDTIESTFVSSVGKYVDKFEMMMAGVSKTKKAVAVVNGTSALQVALRLSGVGVGDEVLTQALTFIATINAIVYNGASPVFLDVDLDTMGLSPSAVNSFLEEFGELRNGICYNKRTNKKIAACMPMHTFGFPVHLEELITICTKWNIPIVEDAAESIGSEYKGMPTGSFGKIAVFSFNGNKVVTSGGGGAIVNISSVQSIGAQKQVVAYSTSKGAINALTRAMAMDFAVDKIRVNSVLPGSVDTPLLRFAAETHKGNKTVDEVVAEWGSSHPIGRMGTIEDIAELVAFLASDRALFITGSDYVIDGGLMAQIPVILPEK